MEAGTTGGRDHNPDWSVKLMPEELGITIFPPVSGVKNLIPIQFNSGVSAVKNA